MGPQGARWEPKVLAFASDGSTASLRNYERALSAAAKCAI